MDSRTPRTWFLKNEWSSESVNATERYHAIQKRAAQDTQDYSFTARIFLVHAPLTFGHSQLVMDFSSDTQSDESTRFFQSADIIRKALFAFKMALNSDTVQKFKTLAQITLTNGSYLKTLILRTSAKEEGNVYKVHLVPYFESHESACQNRFTSIHNIDPEEKGGLLGWLGERETIVDSWQIESDNPFKEKLDNIANNDWRLPQLAELLCQAWPSPA